MAILSKGRLPDTFEPDNSLELSFTNIRSPCTNFVECESFFESNSPDILAICEANLDDLIDSGNFSERGYLPLIRKDYITHMHGLAVYVKEGLPLNAFKGIFYMIFSFNLDVHCIICVKLIYFRKTFHLNHDFKVNSIFEMF